MPQALAELAKHHLPKAWRSPPGSLPCGGMLPSVCGRAARTPRRNPATG